MDNRCRSCIHWAGEPGEQALRRCLHKDVGRVPSTMVMDGAATLANEYIIPSCIIVGPEFGCVHHEGKELAPGARVG
jgi:hypothetical protein